MRKRVRQEAGFKSRLNAGGSASFTRSRTNAVPLPSRIRREPSAMPASLSMVRVRLMPAPAAIFSRSTPRLVWLF